MTLQAHFMVLAKRKHLQYLKKSEIYINTFKQIGNCFTFDTDLFENLEGFACEKYGCSTTNEARYEKFCLKKKAPEPQQLPPTCDALLCHIKRVNYVTSIIKKSISKVNPKILMMVKVTMMTITKIKMQMTIIANDNEETLTFIQKSF